MQTPSYQRNSHKAVAAEQAGDYPMALVYWGKAEKCACNDRHASWARCQIAKCSKIAESLGDQDA